MSSSAAARWLPGSVSCSSDWASTLGCSSASTWACSAATPAIISPTSSRDEPAGNSPMILPRYMTAIRSARASTSSSSVETMTTGVPRSRSATIRLWMNSWAPTSTPRVGCEATSNCSGRDISRARTTFCWLPPDNVLAAAVPLGGRMSNSAIRSRALDRIAPRRSMGPFENSSLS